MSRTMVQVMNAGKSIHLVETHKNSALKRVALVAQGILRRKQYLLLELRTCICHAP